MQTTSLLVSLPQKNFMFKIYMYIYIHNKQSTMYYSHCINCLFLIKFQFCVFSQNSLKNPISLKSSLKRSKFLQFKEISLTESPGLYYFIHYLFFLHVRITNFTENQSDFSTLCFRRRPSFVRTPYAHFMNSCAHRAHAIEI